MNDRFQAFVEKLVERLPRADWPDPTSEWWGELERTFAKIEATPAEATGAISALFAEPPRWLSDVPPALVRLISQARSQNAATGLVGTLEDARRRSFGCPECGGPGLTSRYVWIERVSAARSYGFLCHRCDAGRWLKQYYRSRPPHEARIAALEDYPQYHDERLKFGWAPELAEEAVAF